MLDYQGFVRTVKRLEPGKPLYYFTGALDEERLKNRDLDRIARFAMACYQLGYGQLFQRRNGEGRREYILILHDKLGMRRDGNGKFQEAERVASLID